MWKSVWNAVILINACQSSKLQPDVKDYLERAKTLDKVILVTTSGFGTGKTEVFPIDAISTASQKAQVQSLAAEIMERLDVILGTVSYGMKTKEVPQKLSLRGAPR